MDLYQAIHARTSIRNYKPDAVPKEMLMRVLDATRQAPSACNSQPWRFIIVRDRDRRRELAEATFSPRGKQVFITQAPIVIVACGWKDRAYKRIGGYWNSLSVDITIALDHLMLAAAAEGLGTCWIGGFLEEKVRIILDIPKDVTVIALTPLGFPSKQSALKPRKKLADITCEERWT